MTTSITLTVEYRKLTEEIARVHDELREKYPQLFLSTKQALESIRSQVDSRYASDSTIGLYSGSEVIRSIAYSYAAGVTDSSDVSESSTEIYDRLINAAYRPGEIVAMEDLRMTDTQQNTDNLSANLSEACPFPETEKLRRGYWITGALMAISNSPADERFTPVADYFHGYVWGAKYRTAKEIQGKEPRIVSPSFTDLGHGLQACQYRPTYDELLEALEGMCLQYLAWNHEATQLHHVFMSAGEEALDVLERAGRVRDIGGEIYEWVEGHEYANTKKSTATTEPE